MSYVPNTYAQREEMLAEIGKKCIDELFEAIPQDVRIEKLNLPQGKTEFEVLSELREMSEKNVKYKTCLCGPGA